MSRRQFVVSLRFLFCGGGKAFPLELKIMQFLSIFFGIFKLYLASLYSITNVNVERLGFVQLEGCQFLSIIVQAFHDWLFHTANCLF